MIPASGAGGREFDSLITPLFLARSNGILALPSIVVLTMTSLPTLK
jgi:hypothetical protein